ncbi:glycosyltransferase family 4 protein [Nesterenkonia lutea]|uniref:D-inositol 3-phosphate glycosyltransferase n=1 Tax=Nesterenkonia lutea TaxID=272919 RepID=A0ABR9JDI9_9MICC|nr:glycosyltransferase family 4 protein [Nesterenkonia lutea]MBE1523557.1 hypothetical protein [Nesterenkonia lutea]
MVDHSYDAAPGGAQRALLVPRDLPGPSGGLTYNQRVLEAWRKTGIEVAEVPVPGSWPCPSTADRRALARALDGSPRVLVDGIIASAAPAELAQAAAAGTEVAVLVHLPLPAESGLSLPEQARLAASERAAVHAAHVVVATSGWARDDLQARYGLRRVSVAEPGVDAAPLATGSSPRRLLFLGALTPRKGPLLLLQVLRELTDHPWTAVIAGPDGPDPSYAEEVRAAAAGFPAGQVAVPGPLAGQMLEELWQSTDLLVLPSVAETYGMVVTEALAHGIPVLVGAGTGAEEALVGVAPASRASLATPGAALDPGAAEAWVQTLRRWFEDDTLRRRWQTAAGMHRARLRSWSQAAQDLSTELHW